MVCPGLFHVKPVLQQRMENHIRDATPGGNTFDADEGGGCMFVLADTVASNSFRSTRTQPDRTGRTALYMVGEPTAFK